MYPKTHTLDKRVHDHLFKTALDSTINENKRAESFAWFIESDLDLQMASRGIAFLHKENWKIVLGKISEATGYSFEEMGILATDIAHLKNFGLPEGNGCRMNAWRERHKRERYGIFR